MVLQFDGIDDNVNCGNHAELWSQGLTKFSFSFWIYPTILNDGANNRLLVRHGNTAHGFECDISCCTANRVYFQCRNSVNTVFEAQSNGVIQKDKWNFITCVYDNSLGSANVKIYVNAVVGGTTANLTETLNNSNVLEIGGPSTDLKGFAKDFRFWKAKALSAAEVLQLYRGENEHELTPDYWLPMDETSGDPKSLGLKGILNDQVQWDHNSAYFNGIGAHIGCGTETTLWAGSQTKYSFCVWAKFKQIALDTPFRTLLSMWDPVATNGWSLFQDQTRPNKIITDVQTGGGANYHDAEFDGVKTKDKWYFIAVTYDSTLGSNDLKIYVDGVLGSNTGGDVGTINVPAGVLNIGKFTAEDEIGAHYGNLKQFSYWKDIALTQAEILFLMNGDDEDVIPADYHLDLDENKGYIVKDDMSMKEGEEGGSGDPRWAYPLNTLLTSDPTYEFPLSMKLVIKSNDEKKTYFRYDSNGQKPFKVVGLKLTLADSETDMAVLMIEDGDDLLNNDHLAGGIKYFISLAAGETVPYEDLFIGYGETLDIVVDDRNVIYKVIQIFGSKLVATYRYLNYFRAAKINELEDPQKVSAKEFASNEHVERAIDKDSELLYDPIIISDRAGWDTLDLHKDVNTIISGINLGTVTLWDFMEFQKSFTSAAWGVEWRKGKERFYYQFPELDQTNVILKSGYEKAPTDLAINTAWVYSPFTYSKDTSGDVNHATIVHGITDVDDVFIAGFSAGGGNTNLTFKALAQSLQIPADARRIVNIHLRLSMKGEVSSPQNKVNGAICLADANGGPNGTRLDKFEIPLSEIEEDPKIISVPVDVDAEDISRDTRIWIKLYNRSGTDEEDKGDPNHDEKNTILWHHNNKVNVDGQQASAVASEGDRHDEPLKWRKTIKGPVYQCSVSSDIKRLDTWMTPQIFGQYGIKEHLINVSDLRDRTSVNAYLAFRTFMLALPKSYIPSIKAHLPNNFFFRANQMAFMGMAKPKISQMMRIKRVTYDIQPVDEQAGVNNSSRLVTLSLEGSYNPANYVKFNCEN